MRDTLTSANARDFQSRYLQSYGFYVDEIKDKKVPVFLKNMEGATLYFEDLNKTEFNTRADRGAVFEFMQMTRRIYQGTTGALYYICRKPARQWQRGVCDNNTTAVLLTKEGPVPTSVNNTLMRDILITSDLPAPKIGNLKLSDQFCIVGDKAYLYNNVIGSYSEKAIRVDKSWSSFTPELKEVCSPHTIEVKNA